MSTDPHRSPSSSASAQQPGAQVTREPGSARLDFSRKGVSRPAMQFGMRSLLVAISAAAILLAIGSSLGPGLVQTVIVTIVVTSCMVLLPVCLGTLALYSTGMRRTYFLGAFTAFVLSHIGTMGIIRQMSPLTIVGYLAALVTTSFLSGFVAVATRRFAERRGWTSPADSPDSQGESPSSR
jgi:hypothetical protein